MKKHDFLDLKIGAIEQYSMIVKKTDLISWKTLGWLTFSEIGLPEGDEQAWGLYGEMEECEILIFNRPTLLRDVPFNQLIGREIMGFSTHLGTYGMGGAGFFGLLLDNSEFLTYAVWGAGNHIAIDNRYVECLPDSYDNTRPWFSNFGEGQTWDDLTTYIIESKIENIKLTKEYCNITLDKLGKKIEVTFVKKDEKLAKNLNEDGEISDYILFQHKNGTLIV